MEDLILGYIDPAAGATIMQLVVAGTVGIGAVVKLKWNTIRGFFDRSGTTVDQATESVSDVDRIHEEPVERNS